MNKTVTKEEAISLINENGCMVVNGNLAVVGRTEDGYNCVYVYGRECERVGYVEHDVVTYQADCNLPELNGMVDGSTINIRRNGTEEIVQIYKRGKNLYAKRNDGTKIRLFGVNFNGCEIHNIKYEDVEFTDTWKEWEWYD